MNDNTGLGWLVREVRVVTRRQRRARRQRDQNLRLAAALIAADPRVVARSVRRQGLAIAAALTLARWIGHPGTWGEWADCLSFIFIFVGLGVALLGFLMFIDSYSPEAEEARKRRSALVDLLVVSHRPRREP